MPADWRKNTQDDCEVCGDRKQKNGFIGFKSFVRFKIKKEEKED